MDNGVQLDDAKNVTINPDGSIFRDGITKINPQTDEDGFPFFRVSSNKNPGEKERRYVHVEVLRHHGPFPNLPLLGRDDVKHSDGKKFKNAVQNLELTESGLAKYEGTDRDQGSGNREETDDGPQTTEDTESDSDDDAGSSSSKDAHLERNQDRHAQLKELGTTFKAEAGKFVIGDVALDVADINSADDDEFNQMVAKVEEAAAEIVADIRPEQPDDDEDESGSTSDVSGSADTSAEEQDDPESEEEDESTGDAAEEDDQQVEETDTDSESDVAAGDARKVFYARKSSPNSNHYDLIDPDTDESVLDVFNDGSKINGQKNVEAVADEHGIEVVIKD